MGGPFRTIVAMRCFSRGVGAAAAFMLATGLVAPVLDRGSAQAQQPSQAAAAPTDPASLPDQELGRRFTVKAEDLPPPHTGPVVASRSLVVPYAGQVPRVPEGFTVTPFATGLANPRRLLVLPNGDVIVAEQRVGYLTLLRTVLPGAIPTCWSRTRTGSGACRTGSAHCAPAATSSSAPPTCRRSSASRRRVSWART